MSEEKKEVDWNVPQDNLPKPMVELEQVEVLAFQAGKKGGEEFLRNIWMKVLFFSGSIGGYLFGIISLIVNLTRSC